MKNGRRVKNPKRNSSSRSKSKILDILIIVLSLALVIVIATGTIKDKKTLAKNAENFLEDSDSSSKDSKGAPLTNPYEKIKKGEEINILVLGNGIGLSEKRTDESGNWTSSLSKWLEDTYKVKANITNLSEDKATAKIGLDKLEKNKESFDLAYIIFGGDDLKSLKVGDFKENYENIIKNLKDRNKDISIVSIRENSLRKNNGYTATIEEFGKGDNIQVLDMASVFTKDPAPYAGLTTKGGIYPNNVGYGLYFSNIKSLIEANLESLDK